MIATQNTNTPLDMIATQNKNEFRVLEREDRCYVHSERLLSHSKARALHEYNRTENDTPYAELVRVVADTNYASMKNYISSNALILSLQKRNEEIIDKEKKRDNALKSQKNTEISKEAAQKQFYAKRNTKHKIKISQRDIQTHIACYKSNTLHGNIPFDISTIPKKYHSILIHKNEFITKINIYNLFLDVQKLFQSNRQLYPLLFN